MRHHHQLQPTADGIEQHAPTKQNVQPSQDKYQGNIEMYPQRMNGRKALATKQALMWLSLTKQTKNDKTN